MTQKNRDPLKVTAVGLIVLLIVCILIFLIHAPKEQESNLKGYDRFEVTSQDLSNGKWDARISHDKGEDLSPQLQWDPIDGASCYALYMIDPDGNNWLHMIEDTDTVSLSPGAVTEYIGPYPPNGIHTYEVYVFALKEKTSLPGALNSPSDGIGDIVNGLDASDEGKSGNIIAYGLLSGEYPD